MAYAQPAPVLARIGEERSRVCSVTGLRVYAGPQALTLANAVAAVLALAAGGVFGIAMALTRAPSLELLGSKAYYAALTGHGVAALVLWPVFFEVAAMVFTSTVLLNVRAWSLKVGWASFALMVAGAGLLLGIVVAGHASVGFTAYPPLVAHQLFYLGYLVFAVGVLLAIVNFALTLVKARLEGAYAGTLPLLTYGVAVAAILALLAIVSGLVALVPAWLYSLGWIGSVEPIVYRGWFWGLGHTLQYVNVVAMVVAWYGIAALTLKAGPVNQKFTRFAFVLYVLLTVPVLGHHFLVDPGLSTDVKVVGGTLFGFGLGVPSLMHGLAVIGGSEARLRERGATGLFGWLRRVDYGNASIGALVCSLLLFAIGGWSGTVETTVQLNMLTHNTMWVPAHVHAIVVGGTTLAFMGFAYLLVPLLVRRQLWMPKLATAQAYLYGLGLLALVATQTWAGMLGIPRRVSRVDVGADPHSWRLPMDLMGAAASLAGLAGALFVVIMVMTLLRGKRTEDASLLAPSAERA
ncbi:MAG TPA: cbb3-type cytochrome c oxidase subunit I [Gaiellaceae bacterium]|nr:cbb3-type cytochrome c oxidase subunit I [Gaiellaceae bacterium]